MQTRALLYGMQSRQAASSLLAVSKTVGESIMGTDGEETQSEGS